MDAYRCDIEKQLPKVGYDAVNVLISLNEAVTLAVGNLANDVECIELQPSREVEALFVSGKELVCLVQKQLRRVINKGLVLDQCAHRKGRVDASPELGVESVVDGTEQRGTAASVDDRLLYFVEIGLRVLQSALLNALPRWEHRLFPRVPW